MTKSPSGMMIQKVVDVHVIEFVDASILDQVRVEGIRNELERIVEAAAVPKLVLSFEHVTHISSAVLGVLMSIDKKAKAKRGELRIAGINANIKQIFTITKLDKMLKIFPNRDAALQKFTG